VLARRLPSLVRREQVAYLFIYWLLVSVDRTIELLRIHIVHRGVLWLKLLDFIRVYLPRLLSISRLELRSVTTEYLLSRVVSGDVFIGCFCFLGHFIAQIMVSVFLFVFPGHFALLFVDDAEGLVAGFWLVVGVLPGDQGANLGGGLGLVGGVGTHGGGVAEVVAHGRSVS